MSSNPKPPQHHKWLIIIGCAVALSFVGVGLWAAFFQTAFFNIGRKVAETYDAEQQQRRQELREYLRQVASRLSPEMPLAEAEAARHSFVAEQGDALVWASFGEGRHVTLLDSPQDLGGKNYCGFSGPNALGQLLVCVEEFFNTDQRLFAIDLGSGDAKLVKRVGEKETQGFGPELYSHLARNVPVAAVWLEDGAEQTPGAYYVLAKPVIHDMKAGTQKASPENVIDGRMWLSPDGRRLYGIGLVSQDYAKWLTTKYGSPPDANAEPRGPALFRWRIDSGRVEWLERASSFGMTSDERLLTLVNYGEEPRTISLETRQEVFHMPPRATIANAWGLENGLWYVELVPLLKDLEEKSEACHSGGAVQPAIFQAQEGRVRRADLWVCIVEDGHVHSSAGPWPGPAKRVKPVK